METYESIFHYKIANLQGIGTCDTQEDSFGFSNALDNEAAERSGVLALVCDGMGGMENGKQASEKAVNLIRERFSCFNMNDDIPSQLMNAALEANETIHDILDGRGGCTLVCCLFYRNDMYFISVGDSFIYLKRGGRLFRLNRSQNVFHQRYENEIKAGNIVQSSIEKDDEGHAIYSFIGIGDSMAVDRSVRPMKMHLGDVIMISSDGVAGFISEERLSSCLDSIEPSDICDELKAAVLDNPNGDYRDNFTALVLRCVR